MINDLRKIVIKAAKEHAIDMHYEKKIVENFGHSEEWFVNTFAKLKSFCG